MRATVLWLCILVFASLPFASWSASSFSHRFDIFFEAYSTAYLPENDWRLLKAQCYQESLLEPGAVSPVGAKGLCQFMPGTWREVTGKMGVKASPFNPIMSIRAGAFYMRQLKRGWSSPRDDEPDRNNLALASYNAGFGNILRAQKRCGGHPGYEDIIRCLPEVTGKHSEETITYVKRIRRWHGQMTIEDAAGRQRVDLTG